MVVVVEEEKDRKEEEEGKKRNQGRSKTMSPFSVTMTVENLNHRGNHATA